MSTQDLIHSWNTAINYFWYQDAPLLIALVLLAFILVYRFCPRDRDSMLHTLWLFALCLFGLFLSGVAYTAGFTHIASVLRAAFTVAQGLALIRLAGIVLFRLILPTLRLSSPRILEDLVVILGYGAWGLIQLSYAGLDLKSLVATSAVLTGIVAFSMQDTLGNILAGIALQLDHSVKLGDWIKVDEVVGRVSEIRWRSTSIETRNWETVAIPNSVLMKNKFTVLGRRQDQPMQWRRFVHFNVDLAIPPTRVISIVEKAFADAVIDYVAVNPQPNAVLLNFEEGFGHYALRYWLTHLQMDDVGDSAVRVHIYAAMQRAGIRLAIPEQTVYMVSKNEAHQKEVNDRELKRRIEMLKQVNLFASFDDSEITHLAERVKFAPFARGDIITKQNAIAHWLYILTTGEVDVWVEGDDQQRYLLDTLKASNFFGEIGLMTGTPRLATVIAKTDVHCYLLDKASLYDLLHARPSIADEISSILTARKMAVADLREAHAMTPGSDQSNSRAEILSKIKNFFGLK